MEKIFTLLIYLAGVALIVVGIRSMVTRVAKFPGSDDSGRSDEHRMVEGFPAVLVGLLEVYFGFHFFPVLRAHLPSADTSAFLFGVASLVLGVFTVFTRSVKYSRSGSLDDSEEVTGVRAIGIGIFEVIVGVCLIVFFRHPFSLI